MKFDCKVTEDLLPLYIDNVCSDESRRLVDEHLQQCEKCRTLIKSVDAVKITHIEKDESEKTAIAKKGFKKIHRRWIVSIVAVFMLIPVLFCGVLAYNSYNESGITFSNFDDMYRCYKYLHYIKDGKFEEAAKMVDFSKNEYQRVDCVADMSPQEYQRYMKKRFVKKLEEYEKLGISIANIHFNSSYRWDNGVWCICMSFDEIYPDGSKQTIIADMNGETMYACAYSFPNKNKTERDDYLDVILSLYSEDEASWYKDFEVTFELKKGEKAIIRRDKRSDKNIKEIVNITYGTATSLIDEPYYQNVFEASVPGKYSVVYYEKDGTMKFLSIGEIDIEIIKDA